MSKPTIALDFDGTICEGHNGAPMSGVKDALTELKKDYRIVIYSCGAPARIREWLLANRMLHLIDDIVKEKPDAQWYVDDKAIPFRDWEGVLEQVLGPPLVVDRKLLCWINPESNPDR